MNVRVLFLTLQPKLDPLDGLTATVFMMEYIRTNLFLPGQVENWVLVLDLDNLSLTSIPFKVPTLYEFKFVRQWEFL